ncbi:MAG: hypothetical protein U0075_08405 [Thermomicrobiales bacterium]
MNTQYPYGRNQGSGRMQWGGYGFIAGIVLGVMIGWMFSGFVGLVIRFGLALLVLIPIILLYLAYRKFVSPVRRMMTVEYVNSQPVTYSGGYGTPGGYGSIETRHVVHGAPAESHMR